MQLLISDLRHKFTNKVLLDNWQIRQLARYLHLNMPGDSLGESVMRRNVRGFTLIELMIVVAIIAILASIALPAYNNYRKTSMENACLTELKAYANESLVRLYNDEEPLPAPEAACLSADTAIAIGTALNATPRLPGTRTSTCQMDGASGQGTCRLN